MGWIPIIISLIVSLIHASYTIIQIVLFNSFCKMWRCEFLHTLHPKAFCEWMINRMDHYRAPAESVLLSLSFFFFFNFISFFSLFLSFSLPCSLALFYLWGTKIITRMLGERKRHTVVLWCLQSYSIIIDDL